MKTQAKHCFKIWSPFKRKLDWSPRYSGEVVASCSSKALVSFLRQLRDPDFCPPSLIRYCSCCSGVRTFKHVPSGVLFCVSR